jgi:DNA repair ATPase RecN
MTSSSYPKGSEWRKWDLHIHTPYSIFQLYGGDTPEVWEKYIKELEELPADFAVLGINDYFFLDGYKKLKHEQLTNNRLPNVKLLPVVEFRIEKLAGVDFGALKRINLHVIFSDEVDIDTIQSQFLNTLEQSYTLASGESWTRSITRQSVAELGRNVIETTPADKKTSLGSELTEGFNNLNLNDKQLFDSLKKDCFKGKYLIAVGKTEWADLKWTSGSAATKKTIINNADIVFTAAESKEKFEAARKALQEQEVKSLLLDCSDAHSFSDSTRKDRIGNCLTWIKADPTFEGLKQILYEYDDRVKVQDANPAHDYDKPYFSAISIAKDELVFDDGDDIIFARQAGNIPLNPNLVALIGGRGEGKSMLTDYVASSFIGQQHSKDGNFLKSGNMQVAYQKTITNAKETLSFTLDSTKHAVDFIYINQGHLKSIAENRLKQASLAESIRKLAKLSEPKFDQSINDRSLTAIRELHKLDQFFSEKDAEGNLINNIDFLKQQETDIQNFIQNITTEENKEKLTRYTKSISEMNISFSKINELDGVLTHIPSTVVDINKRIEAVNNGAEKIPAIDVNIILPQINAIGDWAGEINETIDKLVKDQKEIQEEFKDYKGDLTTLLGDVEKFQKQLFQVQKKIGELEQMKKRRQDIFQQLFEDLPEQPCLVTEMLNNYSVQKKLLESEWAKFSDINTRSDLNKSQKDIMSSLLNDLTIEVNVVFDKVSFYTETTNAINGAVWRVKNNKEAQSGHFRITDTPSFFQYLKDRYISDFNDDGFYKEPFTKIFFDDAIRKKFIHVFPILKYQGKLLNKISVGQKGTVYLKMKLATEAFAKPIIFDQPEDDLDNEFIMNDLVELFKSLKKYRQVIIVTHNANLVVNADAEQVIVAKNTNGKLSYQSGSLENSEINDSICRILEGGRLAFENRRAKYKYEK